MCDTVCSRQRSGLLLDKLLDEEIFQVNRGARFFSWLGIDLINVFHYFSFYALFVNFDSLLRLLHVIPAFDAKLRNVVEVTHANLKVCCLVNDWLIQTVEVNAAVDLDHCRPTNTIMPPR